jgi:hypothetical protein
MRRDGVDRQSFHPSIETIVTDPLIQDFSMYRDASKIYSNLNKLNKQNP